MQDSVLLHGHPARLVTAGVAAILLAVTSGSAAQTRLHGGWHAPRGQGSDR